MHDFCRGVLDATNPHFAIGRRVSCRWRACCRHGRFIRPSHSRSSRRHPLPRRRPQPTSCERCGRRTPNPPRGSSARRAEASKKANENVEKAEQERQQASKDAANNPNDASKQAKDLEAQQKLDEAVTDRAKLDDEVREANDAYQNAYKEAETAANNMAADTPDKTLKLRDAKRRYDAALEAAKAKSARVLAPGWNRQRFAELMERQRQATQQGAPGTPQTQPGGATPGTGTGDIGQTQTPPTAAQVPKINVITDIAGGGEGYNTSGLPIRVVRHIRKGRLEQRSDGTRFQRPQSLQRTTDAPPAGPKVAPVEYVKSLHASTEPASSISRARTLA